MLSLQNPTYNRVVYSLQSSLIMKTVNTFYDQLWESAPILKCYAKKFTSDDDTANDLLQDTLEKALRYVGHFQHGTNLKAWLFTIMRNTFINSYRSSTRRQTVVSQQEEFTSHDLIHSAQNNLGETNFALRDINKALACVPDTYRLPFLRHFEGFKYHEIAEEFNIPIGTVKTHIHQARKLLQKKLRAYDKNRN